MENQVLEAIKLRSSARAYAGTELTQEQLDAIIEAGLQAPTAANKQELHFSVIKGDHAVLGELDAEKNQLKGIGAQPHNFYYEAPIVVIISGDKSFGWSALDAGIAVQNMALAAQSLGLGSLIIGCIKDAMRGARADYYARAFAIPDGYEYEIAIALGRKTDNKQPHEYDKGQLVTMV